MLNYGTPQVLRVPIEIHWGSRNCWFVEVGEAEGAIPVRESATLNEASLVCFTHRFERKIPGSQKGETSALLGKIVIVL